MPAPGNTWNNSAFTVYRYFLPLVFILGTACFSQCAREAGKPSENLALSYLHAIALWTTSVADLWVGTSYPAGDVNGDGKKDTAVLRFRNDSVPYTQIRFFPALPEIRLEGYPGTVADVGDLDGNGTDEFVYNQVWFQGNRSTLYVYGYRQGRWMEFGTGEIWLEHMWGETDDPRRYLQKCVRKIDNRHFSLNTLTENTDPYAFDAYVDTMRVMTIPK